MIVKASENLECAQVLGQQYEYYDAAANRAYFAAYQAGWHYLVASGRQVPTRDDRTYWPHGQILSELEDAGMCSGPAWDEEFDFLREQRRKADYRADKVSQTAIADVLRYAERIVKWVSDNAGR